MSEFIQIESVDPEVRDLVNQSAILGANAKLLRQVEISAAAIYESASRLSIRSSHEKLVSRIEN